MCIRDRSWLSKLSNALPNSETKLKFLADGVSLKPYEDAHDDHGDEDEHDAHDDHAGHGHGEFDPHFWHDPVTVIGAIQKIAEDLGSVLKEEQSVFDLNADTYVNNLKDLAAWIVSEVDTIPVENRVLVTSHETMTYFSERYGFKVATSILQSLSSAESVTAKQLASVMKVIEHNGVPAIFADSYMSTKIEDTLADETGVKVVRLDMESLGDVATSYIDMMKSNVTKLVDGLKG